MIRWLIAPESLPDDELVCEYRASDGEDDRACMLLAEIERRNVDV